MIVVTVARRPLVGTVATSVLQVGAGALNIDASRVPFGEGEVDFTKLQRQQSGGGGAIPTAFGAGSLVGKEVLTYKPGGRWPANLVVEHSCSTACFGDAAGIFMQVGGGR